MLDLLILAAVCWAGYADATPWWAVVGAGMMMVGGWLPKMALLRQHPRVPFSSKMTTYLVVSVGINLAFAWGSYVTGHALRWLLAG